MSAIGPLEALYDAGEGEGLPLPGVLAELYGELGFPAHAGRPYVIANFVSTLDGVVSLNVPGHMGGVDISGANQHDRVVMGLLRAVADAVIIGAGTLRATPRHLWTAEHVYPALAAAYRELRAALGKETVPLQVIVTGRGEIDLGQPVFQSGKVPVLIVTTHQGRQALAQKDLPSWVQVEAATEGATLTVGTALSVQEILEAVGRARSCDLILSEAGPHLMGDLLAANAVDELFLTLAPQIAGRDGKVERPGLVAGKSFAPEHPRWHRLISVKRGGEHLFLRYGRA
ncbi:MAG: dihydrofolate reductase family protein [Chloroflexi bacterium]|nr:dihydrofolate reductase family protein [Chloroflexota bacterium]